MSEKKYLAVDLGASSGRVLAGLFDGTNLRLEEMYRFENGASMAADKMYWNVLAQWRCIQDGLQAAHSKYGDTVTSIGVDTWGVDFALLGKDDEMLGNPLHYRNPRNAEAYEKALEILTREEVYSETGLQFMQINSLYQLYAMKLAGSSALEAADQLLMVPDVFHWLLTGEKGNEVTDATTTQLYNPITKTWSKQLVEKLGIPSHILKDLLPTGTNLGKLRPAVITRTGLASAEVILPGTHDTASAVAAVPAASEIGKQPDWCYISSGTWSLMGVEVPHPIITERSAELNFTNEGGVGGTTRVLKNIAGLWLVQECRRVWKEAGHEYSWSELVRMSQDALPLVSLIDPDHASFSAPENMPAAIQKFCSDTGQKVPQTEGEIIRCALESLAMRYRLVHSWLEELVGNRIETIHIVGGGTQNKLLNQMAADACNREVVAGPVEATAIGNLMMQAVASGDVSSITEAREVIRNSFDVEEYTPNNPTAWDDAFGRFSNLLNR